MLCLTLSLFLTEVQYVTSFRVRQCQIVCCVPTGAQEQDVRCPGRGIIKSRKPYGRLFIMPPPVDTGKRHDVLDLSVRPSVRPSSVRSFVRHQNYNHGILKTNDQFCCKLSTLGVTRSKVKVTVTPNLHLEAWRRHRPCPCRSRPTFLSASLYFSKRGAY